METLAGLVGIGVVLVLGGIIAGVAIASWLDSRSRAKRRKMYEDRFHAAADRYEQRERERGGWTG